MAIKANGIRTDCCTREQKEVELELDVRTHLPKLEGIWIHITKGGPTGFESFHITDDAIHDMLENGWYACAGTERSWDTLFIPASEMGKIFFQLGITETKPLRPELKAFANNMEAVLKEIDYKAGWSLEDELFLVSRLTHTVNAEEKLDAKACINIANYAMAIYNIRKSDEANA